VEEHNRPGWGIRFLWRARIRFMESPDQVHGEPGRGARARRPYLVEVGWRSSTDPGSPHVPPAATEPGVRISPGTAIKFDYFGPGVRSICWSQPTRTLHVHHRPQTSPGFESRRVLTPSCKCTFFFFEAAVVGQGSCLVKVGQEGTWRATTPGSPRTQGNGLSTRQVPPPPAWRARARGSRGEPGAEMASGGPRPQGGAAESPARTWPVESPNCRALHAPKGPGSPRGRSRRPLSWRARATMSSCGDPGEEGTVESPTAGLS
jgi:hypothetical protein